MSTDRLVKGLCAAAGRLPIRGALAAALSLLLPGAIAFAADAFSTDWAPAAKSQARLIAGGGDLAGFEIALSPGAITYWRDPGDAGLPPTLDFSGSENVASVEPEFPAPKRIKEADGGEAFGYDGSVVFPLRDQASRPHEARDAQAHCRFRRVRKSVPAGQGASRAHASIRPGLAASRAQSTPLSRQCRAPLRRRISVRLRRSSADSWRLCSTHEDGPPRDLFVEAPEGWWLKTSARAGRRRPRLLHADNRRQTERRRPSRYAPAHAHRRRGGGGDDDPGRAENLGTRFYTLAASRPLYGLSARRLVSRARPRQRRAPRYTQGSSP